MIILFARVSLNKYRIEVLPMFGALVALTLKRVGFEELLVVTPRNCRLDCGAVRHC
jgi:hypothetical protein